MQQQKKSNGQTGEGNPSWTVYSAVQNLPAVLNDPNKGKQTNFLTKTWGDTFVEKVDIPKSPYLPDITMQHFDMYLKKTARVSLSVYLFLSCWVFCDKIVVYCWDTLIYDLEISDSLFFFLHRDTESTRVWTPMQPSLNRPMNCYKTFQI